MQARSAAVSIATYSALGIAVAGVLLLPEELSMPWVAAQSDPGTIQIMGVVRDFRAAHADFDINTGHGHFAGTVKQTLDDGRPSLADAAGVMDGGLTSDIDLVAHWTFDEMAGSTAGDEGGSLDGTLSGGPTWVPGQVGGALHFDGANDIVNIPPSATLNITGDVTISGWFKLDAPHDSSTPSQIILEKYEDDEHNTHIALIGSEYLRAEPADGALVFKVEHGPTGDYYRYKWTNRTSWAAGVWYHFAVTLNSSDSAQNRIFINGVDDTAPTDAGIFPDLDWDYTTEFSIGGKDADYYNLNNPSYFKGCIDDVMIFGRELTESEMTTASAGGYRVLSQWTDSDSRPIAPHLFGVGGLDPWTSAGVRVRGLVDLADGVVDSAGGTVVVSTNSTAGDMIKIGSGFVLDGDALVGPGGDPATVIQNAGTITGATTAQAEAFSMPGIVVPSDAEVGANTGHAVFSGASTHTISSNMHTDDFLVKTDAVVEISGAVTIVIEGEFKTETGGSIRVPDGSSLDVYCTGPKIEVKTTAAWSTPSNTRLWVVGAPTFKIETDAAFYGSIIAPDASLLIQTKGELYGSYIGNELQVKTEGKIHIPDVASDSGDCVVVEDVAGVTGAAGSGGIASAASLRQWYADTLGTNLSVGHTIFLTDDGSGTYEFLTNAFHPIDDQLFGNEGDPHNSFFTFSFAASFEYDECTGQFFEFEGDDSTWVYVDDQLVMDLGGTLPATGQHVAMDRLGLVDGETYMMRFFHAQRQDGSSDFRMRTNMPLSSSSVSPAVSAGFD